MPVSVFNFFWYKCWLWTNRSSPTKEIAWQQAFFRVLSIHYETFDTLIKRIGPLFILEVKITANMDMNVDVKQNIIK